MYHLRTDEMVGHAFWLYQQVDLCKVNTVKDLTWILAILCIADPLVMNQYHQQKQTAYVTEDMIETN